MCLARTLATGPEVLLLDEPTSALDPAPSRQLEELARTLADDGRAGGVGDPRPRSGRAPRRRACIVLVGGRVPTPTSDAASSAERRRDARMA